MVKVEQLLLRDDGQVPNHPLFPLLIYHGAFESTGTHETIDVFASNGWAGAWVNGIFAYHHYHARSHEVLANLGDPVDVQFGGASGPVVTFEPGTAVVIPAGCGHCRRSAPTNLVIVGAYPEGQEHWDLKRADNPADYAIARREIARVPMPAKDPVTGGRGALFDAWR